jgi:hypothetical protein
MERKGWAAEQDAARADQAAVAQTLQQEQAAHGEAAAA